jgi:glycosyltransferase involved in cell wall biosynthesis
MLPISLVIPIRNEQESIEKLIESVGRQTLQPDEVVLVDGGSIDGTVGIVEKMIGEQDEEMGRQGDSETRGLRIRLIKTDGATPGKGRNLGIAAAANDWIALTDAGIRLDDRWLEELAMTALPPRPLATPPIQGGEHEGESEGNIDIVYGNYAPLVESMFDRCAAIAYVPAQGPGGIRGKSIASCLLRKVVWEKVGGFPDMRAAEDLMFMESAEAAGFNAAYAPNALVHWQLRPGLSGTFRKFVLYSKHNVWAGRQWDWHYGILRQYALLVPFLLLAIFHSPWWLIALPLWLAARAAKRILAHRFEYGIGALFNPLIVTGVMMLIVTIDMATFVGWIQAKIARE